MVVPRFTVVGFYGATPAADIEWRSGLDAEAETGAHLAERVRSDGWPIADWFYVATLELSMRLVLASVGVVGIVSAAVEDWQGEGARFWVLGLALSTGAARIVTMRRPRAIEVVEAVMAEDRSDFQFVCSFGVAAEPLYTVENML